MESEKVKEIKKALEFCGGDCDCDCPFYKNGKSYEECKSLLLFEALTLINELERDVLVGKKIAERPKIKESIVAPIYVLPNVESPEIMLKLGEENLVYQFAERLKAKMPCEEVFKGIWDKIDETLKEFIE